MPKTEIEDADFPPLEPGDEPVAVTDPTFIGECLGALNEVSAVGPVQTDASRLTRNEVWGLVYRADFVIGGTPFEGLVNRYVGWRRPDGTIGTVLAIGQDLPPLNTK